MKIKVCGITRLEDARLAAELGAWAIGFVFFRGSPRSISAAKACRIARALPPGLERVGVFVNATAEEILAARDEAGITIAQLHGEETPAFAASLGMPYVRAVRPRGKDDLAELPRFPGASYLLIDAFHETLRGGSGLTADRSLAREAKRFGAVLLAGGLTPENVAEAIRDVEPAGVDVSSGLESAPGVKDHDKMRRFFLAARRAA